MSINIQARLQQIADTAANWTSNDPVLAAGEIGWESDTNKFKFGDGTTAWSSLAYAGGTGVGDALTANPLSQFAATTSAQLAGVLSDETGSGAAVFATSPTLVTPVLGVATATSINKVALTAPATSATLTLVDGTTITGPSATGTLVTQAGTSTLTNKTIASNSNTLTIFTEAHASSHTLSAAECYGAVYYVTSAATLTLPAVASGMSLTVCTVGAVAVSVDANASDLIYLDGTALDDGDKITNLSTAGDIAVLTYYDATGWYAATNGWTDGGP